MAVDHNEIFDKFKDNYMINEFGALKFHLICDHGQVKVGATTHWVMGFSTYTTEDLQKVYAFLKVTNMLKEKFRDSPEYHPELD